MTSAQAYLIAGSEFFGIGWLAGFVVSYIVNALRG